MASGSVWAVALTSGPVRKMAVSTAFLGNDTVVLRCWFSITVSQQAARMHAQRQAPSNPSYPKRRHGLLRRVATLRKRFAFVAGNDVARAAAYAAIALARLSETLSRKPVVDSQRWSAPTKSARSLVM